MIRSALFAAAAVCLTAAPGRAQISTFVDLPCSEALLYVSSSFKCQSAENRSNDGPRTASKVYSTFGTVGKRRVSVGLFYPMGDAVMQPYSAAVSETTIKNYNKFAQGADRWGPYMGFHSTGYMTFKAGGVFCIGFDHAGPNKGQVAGYSYIVRGYVCETSDIGSPENHLRDFLSHVRVGSVAENRNALATAYSPLPGDAGVTAAAPATPAPRAQQAATTASAPLAVQWDGVASLASGSLSLGGSSDGGDLSVLLSMTQGRCRGNWQRTTGANLPPPQTSGTWSLACANGEAASGTYTSAETGKGSGSGIDAKGRKVSISFGQ